MHSTQRAASHTSPRAAAAPLGSWPAAQGQLRRSSGHGGLRVGLPLAAAAAQGPQAVVPVPSSKEEAVQAATAALLGQIRPLGNAGKAKKKGFSAAGSGGAGGSGTRFSVELPLPGDSPAEAAALAADILSRLPPAAAAGASVVLCAPGEAAAAAAAAAAAKARGAVLPLRSACQADSLGGPLVLVEPSTSDVALVEQLLDEVWSGPWALTVNPRWQQDEAPAEYRGLIGSFDPAFSFLPLATQGLMRAEGAVLRQLAPGTAGSPWRVLLKQGDQFVQVGQMRRRPSQSDLELALLNARAASSPLTSLVKGVKGMFDRKQ